MSKLSRSSLTLFTLAMLPAAISIGYQVNNAHKEWQLAYKQAELKTKQSALMSTEQDVEPLAKYLVYPQIEQGRPLTLIQADLANQSTELVKVASTVSEPDNTVDAETTSTPEPVKEDSDRKPRDLDLNALDLTELSPELARRVQDVLGDLDANNLESEPVTTTVVIEPDKLVEQESKYKGKLPALDLQTHMYVSDADRRWVKINGEELNEGDWLNNDIRVISISPRSVVIEFGQQQIEIPALFEWQG